MGQQHHTHLQMPYTCTWPWRFPKERWFDHVLSHLSNKSHSNHLVTLVLLTSLGWSLQLIQPEPAACWASCAMQCCCFSCSKVAWGLRRALVFAHPLGVALRSTELTQSSKKNRPPKKGDMFMGDKPTFLYLPTSQPFLPPATSEVGWQHPGTVHWPPGRWKFSEVDLPTENCKFNHFRWNQKLQTSG